MALEELPPKNLSRLPASPGEMAAQQPTPPSVNDCGDSSLTQELLSCETAEARMSQSRTARASATPSTSGRQRSEQTRRQGSPLTVLSAQRYKWLPSTREQEAGASQQTSCGVRDASYQEPSTVASDELASRERGVPNTDDDATCIDARTRFSRRAAHESRVGGPMATEDAVPSAGPSRPDSPRSTCQTRGEFLDSSVDDQAPSATSACYRGDGSMASPAIDPCHAQTGNPCRNDASARGKAVHEALLPVGQFAPRPTPGSREAGRVLACVPGSEDDIQRVAPMTSNPVPQAPAGPSAPVKQVLSEAQLHTLAGRLPDLSRPHKSQSSAGGSVEENPSASDADGIALGVRPLVRINRRDEGPSTDPSEGASAVTDVYTRLRGEVAHTVATSASKNRAVGHDQEQMAGLNPPTPPVELVGQASHVEQVCAEQQGKEAGESENAARKTGERVVRRRWSPSGRVRKKSAGGVLEELAPNNAANAQTASGKRAFTEQKSNKNAEMRQKCGGAAGQEVRPASLAGPNQDPAAGGTSRGIPEGESDTAPPECTATEAGAHAGGLQWESHEHVAGQYAVTRSTWSARGAARLRALRRTANPPVCQPPERPPSSLQAEHPAPAAAAAASGNIETGVPEGKLQEMSLPTAYSNGAVTVQFPPQQVGMQGAPTVVVQVVTAAPMVPQRGPHGEPHGGPQGPGVSFNPQAPQVLEGPKSATDMPSNVGASQGCRQPLPEPSEEQIGVTESDAAGRCDGGDSRDSTELCMPTAAELLEVGGQLPSSQQADKRGVNGGQRPRKDDAPASGTAAPVGEPVLSEGDRRYGQQAEKRLRIEPAESHAAWELEVWKRSEQVPILNRHARCACAL